jgi:nucleoside-diphosphate-sugar epimerase
MGTRSVIVTGGYGFVGRQTIQPLLERGYTVHIFSSDTSPHSRGLFPDAETHNVNLHDHAGVSDVVARLKASHLLHLAWDTRHGLFWNALDNREWVASSIHLAKCFVEAGGSRLVGAGTCAEYSWEAPEGLLREGNTPETPASFYGRSKLECRTAIAHLCSERKVRFAWGRIFFLFGPHEGRQRLVSAAIGALLRGEVFEATSGEQVRDYSSTVDVGAGFVALLDSRVAGTVNVASGEGRTVKSILLELGELLGRPELIRLGAKAGVEGDPPRLVAAVDRLRAEVGFTAPVSVEERLKETVEWWQTRGRGMLGL